MIIMQYSFTLPADYDMDIIEQRIKDNGARLNDYPGLVFKVYLYARRDDALLPSHENLYAPLYVWKDVQSMQRFLSSSGFAALTQAFGWPSIDTWFPNQIPDASWVKQQAIAHRRITSIAPHSALEDTLSPAALMPYALQAWNSTLWQQLEVTFDAPEESMQSGEVRLQRYRIGYTALGSGLTQ